MKPEKTKKITTPTESKGTSPKAAVPESNSQPASDAAETTHTETLTSTEGISIVCLACYVNQSIHNTIQILKKAKEFVSTNGKQEDIEGGIEIAELILEDLLEELHSRQHGEGLPKGNIPVRRMPFVFTPTK